MSKYDNKQQQLSTFQSGFFLLFFIRLDAKRGGL